MNGTKDELRERRAAENRASQRSAISSACRTKADTGFEKKRQAKTKA